MILRCTYEELRALRVGTRALLEERVGGHGAVAAPPESRLQLEALLPRLASDLEFRTLADLWATTSLVEAVVERLRGEMETLVAAAHPADEGAVAAYFEFAHAFSVLGRLAEAAAEMEALIELVTGEPISDRLARTFEFPE